MEVTGVKYLSVFVLFSLMSCICSNKVNYCHCENREDCYRMVHDDPAEKEVYVLTNGSSDYKQWDWNAITTVIVTEDFTDDLKLMCYAHSKQIKYGFMVDVVTSNNMSLSNPDVEKWVNMVTARTTTSLSDVVVINLMPLLLDSKAEFTSEELINLMSDVHSKLHVNSVDCVVPWKPEKKPNEEESITSRLMPYCDRFILIPDSYIHLEGFSCKARATVPVSKLVLGIDEFVSEGIAMNRIIMGIPWHGYDYTCKTFNETTQICTLNYISNDNKSICDVMSRKKVVLGNFALSVSKHHVKKTEWNDYYKAPFHSYYDKETNEAHQVWLEDVESLRLKYTYARDLQMKGIAIWTGDDMSYSKLDYYQVMNEDMWSWILHDMLQRDLVKPRDEKTFYYPNTVTAVALSCLFGGLILGVIFTCIGFRRMRKDRRPPFQKDRDSQLHVDDYHDEDLNL